MTLSSIPSINHPVKREGAPNDAPFSIGNGSFVYTGNQLAGGAIHFVMTPLGVERHFEDGTIERLVLAPEGEVYATQRTNEPIRFHGTTEGDPTAWVRSHAAAAQRRRMEELTIAVPASAIHDEIEWAKFRVATLPPDHEEAIHARKLLNEIADSVVGIEADPEKGRLTLRPWLPVGYSNVIVDNIRIDDALIKMRYHDDAEMTRFIFMQTRGAYPIRLIFEPALTKPFKHAFVDSTLADLNVRNEGGRIIAPVQLMLDAERTVTFQK